MCHFWVLKYFCCISAQYAENLFLQFCLIMQKSPFRIHSYRAKYQHQMLCIMHYASIMIYSESKLQLHRYLLCLDESWTWFLSFWALSVCLCVSGSVCFTCERLQWYNKLLSRHSSDRTSERVCFSLLRRWLTLTACLACALCVPLSATSGCINFSSFQRQLT